MNERDKAVLKASLTGAIDAWWLQETEQYAIEFPWIGESVLAIMADAALAVLLGIADTQEYLKSEEVFKE